MRQEKRDRQAKILDALGQAPSLRVAELASSLQVSTETIRRDLDELTEAGLLNRTYGGAVRPQGSEPGIAERKLINLQERRRIAQAATRLVGDARSLLLGSGATVEHVAREIAARLDNIMVTTHSCGVAAALASNSSIEVMLIPGLYHAAEACVFGGHAIVFLQNLYADYVILGASGVDQDGPNNALAETAAVNAAMLGRSAKSIVVADQGKFNQQFATRYASWTQIGTLGTDAPPPENLASSLNSHNVRLLVAAETG